MYNLEDENTLTSIIEMVESSTNAARLEEHENKHKLVWGDIRKLVEEDLQKRYPDSWHLMTPIALKIAKKIVKKLGRCYSTGCTRSIIGSDGKKHEEFTDLIEKIYSSMNDQNQSINEILSHADKLYTVNQYVELFAYLNAETKKINLKPLPQHLFTAIPDATKTFAELIIFKHDHTDFTMVHKFIDWEQMPSEVKDGKIEGIYTIWSKDKNITVSRISKEQLEGEREGEVVFRTVISYQAKNERNINPINKMPFVGIKEISDGYYYPAGSEVPEIARDLNGIISDIVSIAAQQGFGQAVVYYDDETPPAITKSGPTHIIAIPNKDGKSKFEFANANPDLMGHINVALTITRMLLTTNDLTTDKVSGELSATNFASAIDRLIADSETTEHIDDQRKKYLAAESKLFEVIRAYLIYLQGTELWPEEYPAISKDILANKEFKLKLHFNSIKPMITEKDKATTIVYLDENGFILPHEKHLRFNDGMTDTEAREREEKIRKIKKERSEEALEAQTGGINASIEDKDNINKGNIKERQKEHRNSKDIKQERSNKIGERDSRPDQRQDEKRKGSNKIGKRI